MARVSSLPREARDTLFLLGVIAWILLPQAGRLPLWCSLGAAVVLAWRAWLAIGSRPLPGRGWLATLLALSIAATLLTHQTVLGRDAGVTLIVILLALKTLELRARRDAFVIFFLGFFTMLTNFFFSQSLLTAASMLVGLLGLLTALVNAHMPVGRPSLLAAARTAGWMALLGAPIMAVLFMLFPRFAPLWGISADGLTGRSGLSSSMEVGNIARLALDDGIAMRIRFQGAPPEQPEMYFRGPVLAQFDGRSWLPLQPLPAAQPLPALTGTLQVSGEPVRYEVTLEPNNRPWILVLDATPVAPELPLGTAAMSGELQWLTSRPVTDLLRYRAESYVRYRQGPFTGPHLLPLEYRELPPGFNPRTLALATELMRSSRADPEDKAALVSAALDRLRRGGYSYTLEPGVYGTHTADEFWFDRREGFCEHIASAFVVLMRGMDIPARVVTGYQGGERNGLDGFWTVRQSDAHAWAEVWLAGTGWVRVDPTAAVAPGRTAGLRRLRPAASAFASAIGTVSPGLAASMRAAWEAMNNGWNQWVLNYTQSRQLNLLKSLGFASPSWIELGSMLLAVMVVAALGAVAWGLWDRTQHDPWLRTLIRVRKRLLAAGLELHASAGPRQIATAVTQRFGSNGEALADWLLKLEAQRYARSPATSLTALLREFKKLSWPA